MTHKFITANTNIDDAVLNVIAHLPTTSLSKIIETDFWKKLSDKDFMRIAVLLAQKSYDEAGCPVGAVIIDNQTKQIVGKGHNTLVQENHPCNHGETAAIRDAGRLDFSQTTLFTSLSPCDVCAALLYLRQFKRVVIGDVTNAKGSNISMLKDKNLTVDILEDEMGINLYKEYKDNYPELDIEDWKGKAAV